jgi:hypothetical protein
MVLFSRRCCRTGYYVLADVAEQGIIFSQILQNRVLFSRRYCRTGYYFLADVAEQGIIEKIIPCSTTSARK